MAKCRLELMRDGEAYPKSGCAVHGSILVQGGGCPPLVRVTFPDAGPSDLVSRLFDGLRLRLDEQGAAAEHDRAKVAELGEMVVGLLAVGEAQRSETDELKDRVLALEGS